MSVNEEERVEGEEEGRDGETESNSFADALTAAGGVAERGKGRGGRVLLRAAERRDGCSSRTLNQILIKRNCEMIFHYQLYA